MKRSLLFLAILMSACMVNAKSSPQFSTAGFFAQPGTGREVYNMNSGWRLMKGKVDNAWLSDFNDSQWEKVNLPNGVELLPVEASGCMNYQGEAWYRKHFSVNKNMQGKKLFLHFEAIMGKSKVWINGQLLKEHLGGYLPVIVDISDKVSFDNENVITVLADNSNDPSYPPGKAQEVLDFTYFGGIYRDCWLIVHNPVYITDPNYEDKIAGGGLFVAYDNISEQKATVIVQLNVKNEFSKVFGGEITFALYNADQKKVASSYNSIKLQPARDVTVKNKLEITSPSLWSPNMPYLYYLQVRVKDKSGKVIDGYMRRIGIRSIEMRGEQGFFLNGKLAGKLMGANRHQDFAVVGNALPNSVHWRDAKKLRDVGMKIIRNAHYPQDPAFMDACDELGLFVIVTTPGWQFWNNNGTFEKLVFNDIRNMVRRDRNHPSVIFWEPILNETDYPDYFAKKTTETVAEEYPFRYCYWACDAQARGHEFFPINYGMPQSGKNDPSKTYFTREWGDNVDDWNAHNSTSRVSKDWGEHPMLLQAINYAKPPFDHISYNLVFSQPTYHFGGCLWHSFDHQRGYHPDPFYGGIMDPYRLPKTSYYMFMSERDPNIKLPLAESGPMVYIANIMSPFSDNDVTVFSNCDQVRLISLERDTAMYTLIRSPNGIPFPVITFKNRFSFMEIKALDRQRRKDQISLVAEGIIDGKVVAHHKFIPAFRPAKITLEADNAGMPLEADGSDFVVVVARITDDNGTIKRLNNSLVKFEIEGEGRILLPSEFRNTMKVEWGEAPVIIQSTNKSGTINVRARLLNEGSQRPIAGMLTITTKAVEQPAIFIANELPDLKFNAVQYNNSQNNQELQQKINQLEKELNSYKLKEVEKQQTDFEPEGIKH